MQGRYRGRYVIAPPITQFRKGTEKALDPPPVGAFSFWSSGFYRDPRWRNWCGGRVGLLRLGVYPTPQV